MSMFDTGEQFAGGYLSHFGVRGMKWGQRRAEAKAARQEHKDWLKDAKSEKTANEVFQATVKSVNKAQKVLNNDPAFKGKDLTKDPGLARKYDRVMEDTFNAHMSDISMNRTLNKTMDRAVRYQFDRSLGMMRATEVRITHAEVDTLPRFRATMDRLGHVSSFSLVEDALVQGATFAENYMEHFGVRGMRWGRRKDKGNSAVDESRSKATEHDSEDFARTSAIAVKAKSTGLRSLSNREMRDLVDRINLEQNFARINTPEAKKTNPITTGVKYVSGKLTKTADMTVDSILKTAVQIKVTEEMKKRMATSGKAG